MNTKFVVLEKKVGETPLQAIEFFRRTRPELNTTAMTYAGRLDPMAEGKLIVLIGDECKKRDRYTKLDKEYEFKILFGVSSDTGDVLGLARSEKVIHIDEKRITEIMRNLVGTHTVSYPAFSSKTVNGKPLFEHALAGSINSIEIPEKNIKMYRMQYLGKRDVERKVLLEEIFEKIGRLKVNMSDTRLGSDFRKSEILARWAEAGLLTEKTYVVAKFRAVVSSGTYIRTLAPLIAERLDTIGLAYSIRRIKIGRYHPFWGSLGFWTSVFS